MELSAGWRHLKFEQEIYGVRGWQLDSLLQRHSYTVADVHALSYVDLAGELTRASLDGSQTQRWYGDDPGCPNEDDTGTVVSGLSHEFKLRTGSVGLRFGVEF